MKELLILPMIGILLITVAIELESIAHEASDKALNFADDMNNAMDCAVHGRLIKECSPELMDTDFKPEIERTVHTLKEFEKIREDLNRTIIINGTLYVAI